MTEKEIYADKVKLQQENTLKLAENMLLCVVELIKQSGTISTKDKKVDALIDILREKRILLNSEAESLNRYY